MEPWIWLSLAAAFFLAVSDTLVKMAVTRADEISVAWLRLVFALPVLYAGLWFSGFPRPDSVFVAASLIALPFEAAAIILYVKALRASPMSLTLPFLSLSPVFVLVFSFLILGEPLTPLGIGGIALVAAGGFLLNLDARRHGVLGPLRAVFHERGSRYMLAVALCYSLTSALGKVGITHSSPLFFGATYLTAVTVVLTVLRARLGNSQGRVHGRAWPIIAASGIAYGLMAVCHMYAMGQAQAAYMIALKRSSILMGVAAGFLFFREERPGQRSLGAAVMFSGLVLIVLAS